MANQTGQKIVIGIPTFKRPQGLRLLLESIADTKAPFTPHILVADNEGQGEGSGVVEEMQRAGYPFPLTVIPVYDRGISQARNALLEEGFEALKADFLAMVDDDERVEPEWIAELVDMQQKTGADVVWGWVLPEFDIPPENWMKNLVVYFRPKLEDGETEDMQGTTSVLLSRSVWKNRDGEKNLFDSYFSRSGGGDTDYFQRLQKQNIKCAFTAKAVSHELFPATRMNRKWVLQRAYNHGTATIHRMKRQKTLDNPLKWSIEIVKIPVMMIAGTALCIFGFWSGSLSIKGAMMFVRQTGKVAGLLGRDSKEYTVTHGK